MMYPTLNIERSEFRDDIVDFELNMFAIFHRPSNFVITTQSLRGEDVSSIKHHFQ